MSVLRRSHSVRSLTALVHRTTLSSSHSAQNTRYETRHCDAVNGNVADNPLSRLDTIHDLDSEDMPPERPASRLGYTQSHSLTPCHERETKDSEQSSRTRAADCWRQHRVVRRMDLENDDDIHGGSCEVEGVVGEILNETPQDEEDVEMEDVSSSDDSTSTSGSEYSDSDIDEAAPLFVARACTPEPEPESSSESCHERQPHIVPDKKPKYSCLPSPLSLPDNNDDDDDGNHDAVERQDKKERPARHGYKYRGYSFHSFQNMRSFWAKRQDQWAESVSTAWTPDVMTENEGDAMETEVEPEPTAGHELPWPHWLCCMRPFCEKMHPRTGDLDSLRDPYSKDIDECFYLMPMWTMRKMLWMWAVQAAVAYREQVANESMGEDEVEVESESTVSTDASDQTLVEEVGEKMVVRKPDEMVVDEGREEWWTPVRLNDRAPNWALTAYARWELLNHWTSCQYPPQQARFFL